MTIARLDRVGTQSSKRAQKNATSFEGAWLFQRETKTLSSNSLTPPPSVHNHTIFLLAHMKNPFPKWMILLKYRHLYLARRLKLITTLTPSPPSVLRITYQLPTSIPFHCTYFAIPHPQQIKRVESLINAIHQNRCYCYVWDTTRYSGQAFVSYCIQYHMHTSRVCEHCTVMHLLWFVD